MHLDDTTLARFWSKVDKTSSPNGCWLWTAGTSGGGYGAFKVRGRQWGAHQFAYVLHHGVIPEGQILCHNCPGGDNPACVNPDHLFPGTHADNAHDRDSKGRSFPTKGLCAGEKHPKAKLTDADVLAIRAIPATVSHASLARTYGVSAATITVLRQGRTWRHLLPSVDAHHPHPAPLTTETAN